MTAQPQTGYLTEEQLIELARQLADEQHIVDEHTKRADAIKAQIRDGVPGPDTYAAGGVDIVVSANRRYSETEALKVIPAELRPVVVQTVEVEQVNRKLLEAIAPMVYAQAFTEYTHKVAIR